MRLIGAIGAAVALTALAGCGGGHSSAARRPTASERAALQQAVYDFVVEKTRARNPVIVRMRVAAVRLEPPGASPYAEFARVDLSDPAAGYAYAILGYRHRRLSRWRVLDIGSAAVGCELGRSVFGSHGPAVRRALGLACP
ncbi:MAG TPA: hypothetical protein VMB53_07595 [Gaiellaceae bacterium]|nr:hypothetical protein [Gaiellaceae bacterium]